MDKTRRQKFIENVAKGEKPYRACINAGYTEYYARTHASEVYEKCKKEIEEMKPLVRQAIEEDFKYTVKESFKKLNEIQDLALLQDEKGNFNNLGAAIKAEELKGRMYGVYELDNVQKQAPELTITVTKKD